MLLQTPIYEAIRDAILRDIRNLLPAADVTPDSDNYVRASSVAAAAEGLYQHQAWLFRQIWPDTSDSEALEHHAAIRGLARKPAVAAVGSITVTGWIGTVVPAGSLARHTNGTELATMQDTPIGAGGTASVLVQAVVVGADANGLTGDVTLTSPPLGVDAQATLDAALAGGADIESDADLLQRLLSLIRQPPAGGNQYDYERWALDVPGVAGAYVYPLRRGLGTVDVVIVSDSGLPGAQLISDVQDYIDRVRPVTAYSSLVLAPEILSTDITAQVALDEGYTLADVQASAETQLAAAVNSLAPGETLYKSRVEAAISALPGVIDRTVSAPAANVTATVDAATVQWIRLGTVTLSLMP